jgi:hypothetical protein
MRRSAFSYRVVPTGCTLLAQRVRQSIDGTLMTLWSIRHEEHGRQGRVWELNLDTHIAPNLCSGDAHVRLK